MAEPLETWAVEDRPTLLLTEDDGSLSETLAGFFEGRGFDVSRASSLAESRARLAAARFDAVVLDVELPDGDGLSLLERISPERVVVISANPEPERYARCAVRRHLAKPLDLDALARAVDAALGRAEEEA